MAVDRTRINGLLREATSGDNGAFGRLADEVQDHLYRFGLAHGLGPADAAEVTQETLLRAYSARARWTAGSDGLAWLTGIAMNVVRENHRKRRRQESVHLELGRMAASSRPGDPQADAETEQAKLLEAVAGLPPRQREAVICRFLLQMSIRDTAEAMGCAEGTIKSCVAAGLENLRAMMRKDR